MYLIILQAETFNQRLKAREYQFEETKRNLKHFQHTHSRPSGKKPDSCVEKVVLTGEAAERAVNFQNMVVEESSRVEDDVEEEEEFNQISTQTQLNH